MSDEAYGIYILQQWASVSGASPQSVVSAFISKYGHDSVVQLGHSFNTQNMNIDAVKSQFQSLIDEGSSADSPTQADINTAILAVSGTPPSWGSVVSAALAKTADQIEAGASVSFSVLKYVAILALVLGAGYVAFQTGALKGLRRA